MILVSTPTRDSVTAGTMCDVLRLYRHNPETKFMAALGIYIANLRNQSVQTAQQMGASHILFIDSDMRFPEDTLDRLLAHDQRIVAANSVQRTMPEWWTARVKGVPTSSIGQHGLQRVDSVGCGVMLIRLDAFKLIPQPWFSSPWNGKDHMGEDVYFCHQAEAFGVPVWIDHDLSQDVRHQGSFELGVESQRVLAVA